MVRMFKYSLDLVFRRKLRTFLTSLGIVIAVILMSFILFGMSDLESLIVGQFTEQFKPNELTVVTTDMIGMMGGALSAPTKEEVEQEEVILNSEAIEKIESIDGIETVNRMVRISGLDIYLEDDDVAYPRGFPMATDMSGDHSMIGGLLEGDDLFLDGDEVYVSDFISQFYELSNEEMLGKKIILKSSVPSVFSAPSESNIDKEYELTIVGVTDSSNNALFVGLDKGLEIATDLGGYESKEKYIDNIGYTQLLLSTNIDKTSEIEDQIVDELGFSVLSTETLMEFVSTITGGLTIALVLFGSISGLVASIGIINTMIMSIYEQTKEIGIIKAIGASDFQVLIIFLIQSAMIGLLGGLMGLGITFGLMKLADPFIVDLLVEEGFGVSNFFNFRWDYAVYIALGSILIGIVAGIYPAYKASRLDPVEALRHD
ncbi:MAG: permease [candidate division WS6 bacterium 34_10]|uniref:Permease n=1 Tax=candidate division WS6 bacterium 34_10 TaxID=1641389 RepID=A0A124FX85_9BACT|nr:MAG: permease [candidate division WS6 bacterium 34_10]